MGLVEFEVKSQLPFVNSFVRACLIDFATGSAHTCMVDLSRLVHDHVMARRF